MPGTLLAAMLAPVPVQQQTMPSSASPAATVSATCPHTAVPLQTTCLYSLVTTGMSGLIESSHERCDTPNMKVTQTRRPSKGDALKPTLANILPQEGY
jgi:hypothetical protein